MSILRTPEIEVDQDFEVTGEVTKSWVDRSTGKRYIVGVASGVAEDRDGERVSRNAIAKMARDVATGGIKLTSSHQQDWMTEIGDAVEASHDPKTDELIVKTELPPEGEDAIADKAWKTANREKVGFSVGGKLLKAFYERNEVGKKRKVLDSIGLKHFMLTKNPSYADSFAQAVAKSWDPDRTPSDDEFTEEVTVEKETTGSWVNGSSDSGGGRVGRDSVGSGSRNAGTKTDSKAMSTEEDGSNEDEDKDEDSKDLPQVKDERHLACPNCGHEFAADLPVDPDERQVDETGDDNENDDQRDESDTGKSVETPLMSKLTEKIDELRALAGQAEVAKSDEPKPDPAPAEGEPTVEKTETSADEVAKMVGAAYSAHEDRFATLEKNIGEGFELIAKSHQSLKALIEELPQGRRSVARVLPSAVGHDGDVGKSTTDEDDVEKAIDEAPDALTALKILNSGRR